MKFIYHISLRNRKNIGISVFVCFFLIVFTPFDIQQWSYPERLYYVLGYGLCTLLGMYSWDILKPTVAYALPNGSPAKQQVIYSFSVVLIISLFNFVYSYMIGVVDLNLQSFLLYAGITLAVGIFPSILLYYDASRKDASRKVRVTESSFHTDQTRHSTATIVTLQGDNQNEVLRLPEHSLLFIKAALNYSEVFILKEGQLRREILRISMNRVEEQLEQANICRTHRSYICNLRRVDKVSRKNKGLLLSFPGIEEAACCSRKYKSEISKKLHLLNKFQGKMLAS